MSTSAICRAAEFSSYLRCCLDRDSGFMEELKVSVGRALTLESMCGYLGIDIGRDDFKDNFEPLNFENISSRLRRLRRLVICNLIVRDLNGYADLDEVFNSTVTLANLSLNLAYVVSIDRLKRRFGRPIGSQTLTEQSMFMIGMGKLGGLELNVSSDVDLVFLFEEPGETDKRVISNQEFFTRLAKQIIQILNEMTYEGFVFRVDMRLRPHGDSGPLVMSSVAFEHYLITQGREWERYAWIKSRISNMSHLMTENFTHLRLFRNHIRPFVYRRYLDFNAYESMRELYFQIKSEVNRLDKNENNIKLGRGGIREIEFIVQVFQLIRGGKLKELRSRPTRKVLKSIAQLKLLPEEVVTRLLESYEFLRNLEHRLQYLDDQQTQTLPVDPVQIKKIALSMGFQTESELLSVLDDLRSFVSEQFSTVFLNRERKYERDIWLIAKQASFSKSDSDAVEEYGKSTGMDKQSWMIIKDLASSRKYKSIFESSRRNFDFLVNESIRISRKFGKSIYVLRSLLRLLESNIQKSPHLALLAENPYILEEIARIFTASSWLVDYLTNHSQLLYELIEPELLYDELDWDKFYEELDLALSKENDTDGILATLASFQHRAQFKLIIQDIRGRWSVEALSDQLSFLACTILKCALKYAWLDIKSRHLDQPRIGIIAYGKLGGLELGYIADLDVIFIFDDPHVDAMENYVRLVKKLSNWLTANLECGRLYELDLRLRPDGASGMLVSSVSGFEYYQLNKAWIWEHQALTRARFVTGFGQIEKAFDNLKNRVLTIERDLEYLKSEIISMRKKIDKSHPPIESDLKYSRGGIVDLEFIVQYLILAHSCRVSRLLENKGNIALLEYAAEGGLITFESAFRCGKAYRYFRKLQHSSRLSGDPIMVSDELLLNYDHVKTLWIEVFKSNR